MLRTTSSTNTRLPLQRCRPASKNSKLALPRYGANPWTVLLTFMYLGPLQVTAQVRRIEAVEKDLKALSHSSASKDDLSRVRAEAKKLYDGLHIGMLSLEVCVPS